MSTEDSSIPFSYLRNGIIITLIKYSAVLYIPTSLNYSFHILVLFPHICYVIVLN